MFGEMRSLHKILDKLYVGGMNITYKATDMKLDRYIALKFLYSFFSMNDKFKLSITQEAKISAKLEHPNKCSIHEVDEIPDGPTSITISYY